MELKQYIKKSKDLFVLEDISKEDLIEQTREYIDADDDTLSNAIDTVLQQEEIQPDELSSDLKKYLQKIEDITKNGNENTEEDIEDIEGENNGDPDDVLDDILQGKDETGEADKFLDQASEIHYQYHGKPKVFGYGENKFQDYFNFYNEEDLEKDPEEDLEKDPEKDPEEDSKKTDLKKALDEALKNCESKKSEINLILPEDQKNEFLQDIQGRLLYDQQSHSISGFNFEKILNEYFKIPLLGNKQIFGDTSNNKILQSIKFTRSINDPKEMITNNFIKNLQNFINFIKNDSHDYYGIIWGSGFSDSQDNIGVKIIQSDLIHKKSILEIYEKYISLYPTMKGARAFIKKLWLDSLNLNNKNNNIIEIIGKATPTDIKETKINFIRYIRKIHTDSRNDFLKKLKQKIEENE